jgi:serine/threonine-protein kinase SIK2
MLVVDPKKRYTLDEVKRHPWMTVGDAPKLLPPRPDTQQDLNNQIVRLMQSLGIDQAKTREVLRNAPQPHPLINQDRS